MKTILALAIGLVTAFAPAITAAPRVSVDVYSVPRASIDALVPGRRDAAEEGSGFGLRSVVRATPTVVILGELRSASYGGDIDYDQLRLGVGTPRVAGGGASGWVEYVGTELSGAPADGLGGHVRYASSPARRWQLHGEGGLLVLRDSAERIAGWEAAAGGALRLTRWLGLFAEYRATRLGGQSSGLELELADLRVGARMTFGGGERAP